MVSRIDEAVKEYSTQFDKLMFMLKEQVNALLNVMYVVRGSVVIQNHLYHDMPVFKITIDILCFVLPAE